MYRQNFGDEEKVSQISRLVDVWQQVRIKYISVPLHYEAQNAYFRLYAECDWDEEHGLAVRFRNGVAFDSDQIGDCRGAWDDTPEYLEQTRQAIEAAVATALKKPDQPE